MIERAQIDQWIGHSLHNLVIAQSTLNSKIQSLPNLDPLKLTCKQCGKKWLPRTENPQRCPNITCQAKDWDSNVKRKKRKYLKSW